MEINLVLVSVLEGFTEFLPISSTAHLIILSKILSIDLSLPYVKFYLLAIQLGALLAGVLLFTKKLLLDKKLFINIVISFIPSAIMGFILYKTFKHLLEGNFLLLSLMLFLGGIIFIWLEKFYIKTDVETEFGKEEITKLDAFVVGIAQAIAIIPGVSRSGATIIAGIFRGIKKSTIIEYTFILALPTILAAVLYDTYKSKELFTAVNSYTELGIGILISFVVAFLTLYTIKNHLNKISLTGFGIYRIILATLVFFIYFV